MDVDDEDEVFFPCVVLVHIQDLTDWEVAVSTVLGFLGTPLIGYACSGSLGPPINESVQGITLPP